jgi:hypothetical protein
MGWIQYRYDQFDMYSIDLVSHLENEKMEWVFAADLYDDFLLVVI